MKIFYHAQTHKIQYIYLVFQKNENALQVYENRSLIEDLLGYLIFFFFSIKFILIQYNQD